MRFYSQLNNPLIRTFVGIVSGLIFEDMVAEQRQFITQDAYLAMEREAFEKSEYFEGQLYLIAGATKEHNRIKENLSIEIGYFLKEKSCQSFSSDFRVHIPKNGLYAYPDLIVVCDEPELLDETFDTLLNPTVLIEILSKSTRGYDQNAKFALYRDIPTLREYLLIDSRRIKIEIWQKSTDGVWSLSKETDQPDDTIQIETIDLLLFLHTIYNRVPGLLA